jgi:hypothetical protein
MKIVSAINLLRIGAYLATLLLVNMVCGSERLHYYLAANHPGLAAAWIGEWVRTLYSLFRPVSFAFETFVLWFCTDLLDVEVQGLFDWRHGMMCFLFTVLISVAFFAMGSVIVDRVSKHGEGT